MTDEDLEELLRASSPTAPRSLRVNVLVAVNRELAPTVRDTNDREARASSDPWRYASIAAAIALSVLWSLATWSAALSSSSAPHDERGLASERDRVAVALSKLLPDLPPAEVSRLSRTMVRDPFSH